MDSRKDSRVRIRPLGQPGDLGWVVMAHGDIYAAESASAWVDGSSTPV